MPCASDSYAVQRIIHAANARWELEAIDYRPKDKALFLRVGAPEEAIDALVSDIVATWEEDSTLIDGNSLWPDIHEFAWVPPNHAIAKVTITSQRVHSLTKALATIGIDQDHLHLSAEGAQGWLAIPEDVNWDHLNQQLTSLLLSGLAFRGKAPTMWIGERHSHPDGTALAKVFDSDVKFLSM